MRTNLQLQRRIGRASRSLRQTLIERIRNRHYSVEKLARSAATIGPASFLAAWIVMPVTGVMAGEPAWPAEPYRYTIIEQDLTSVLQEFGRNTGLRVEVSTEVRGRVRGPLPELKARDFLDHLARGYGLEWYFDGFRLYVTSAKEDASRILPLGSVPLQRLETALTDLSLHDARFSLRAIKQSDMMLVAGPPQYLVMVERTLAALKPRHEQPSVVTVYRGDHIDVVKLDGAGDPP